MEPRSTHGNKYRKYKKCLIMIIFICTKQNLSNIWGLIHENVKQHWGWLEKKKKKKKALLMKKSVHSSDQEWNQPLNDAHIC